jgi:putative DNA primase/helicase
MRAETIAKGLGGHKVGGGWMARCPAHEDRNPILSIQDADEGKVLVCCHASSDQARVSEALRTRALWSNRPQDPLRAMRATQYQARTDVPDRDDDKRTEAAMRIWREARRPAGGA